MEFMELNVRPTLTQTPTNINHTSCISYQVCDARGVLFGKGNCTKVQSDCLSVFCVDTCQLLCSVGNCSLPDHNVLREGCGLTFVIFTHPGIVLSQKVFHANWAGELSSWLCALVNGVLQRYGSYILFRCV